MTTIKDQQGATITVWVLETFDSAAYRGRYQNFIASLDKLIVDDIETRLRKEEIRTRLSKNTEAKKGWQRYILGDDDIRFDFQLKTRSEVAANPEGYQLLIIPLHYPSTRLFDTPGAGPVISNDESEAVRSTKSIFRTSGTEGMNQLIRNCTLFNRDYLLVFSSSTTDPVPLGYDDLINNVDVNLQSYGLRKWLGDVRFEGPLVGDLLKDQEANIITALGVVIFRWSKRINTVSLEDFKFTKRWIDELKDW